MSSMVDASKTTPRRVLRRASELGVHADCVAADYDGACQSCIDIIHSVFQEFYGHHETAADFLAQVIEEILEDRRSD